MFGGAVGIAAATSTKSVILTNAQVKSLPGTAVEIIPAPGSGKLIIPTSITLFPTGMAAHPYTGMAVDSYLNLGGNTIVYNDSGLGITYLNTLLAGQGGVDYFFSNGTGFGALAAAGSGIISQPILQTSRVGQSLALILDNNGVSTDLGGGNANNTLLCAIQYAVLNTSTGQFS